MSMKNILKFFAGAGLFTALSLGFGGCHPEIKKEKDPLSEYFTPEYLKSVDCEFMYTLKDVYYEGKKDSLLVLNSSIFNTEYKISLDDVCDVLVKQRSLGMNQKELDEDWDTVILYTKEGHMFTFSLLEKEQIMYLKDLPYNFSNDKECTKLKGKVREFWSQLFFMDASESEGYNSLKNK